MVNLIMCYQIPVNFCVELVSNITGKSHNVFLWKTQHFTGKIWQVDSVSISKHFSVSSQGCILLSKSLPGRELCSFFIKYLININIVLLFTYLGLVITGKWLCISVITIKYFCRKMLPPWRFYMSKMEYGDLYTGSHSLLWRIMLYAQKVAPFAWFFKPHNLLCAENWPGLHKKSWSCWRITPYAQKDAPFIWFFKPTHFTLRRNILW